MDVNDVASFMAKDLHCELVREQCVIECWALEARQEEVGVNRKANVGDLPCPLRYCVARSTILS